MKLLITGPRPQMFRSAPEGNAGTCSERACASSAPTHQLRTRRPALHFGRSGAITCGILGSQDVDTDAERCCLMLETERALLPSLRQSASGVPTLRGSRLTSGCRIMTTTRSDRGDPRCATQLS